MERRRRERLSRLAAAGAFLAACAGIGAAASAATYQSEVQRLTRGLPAEVADFIGRRAECNHWAGEEAYDAARAAQIQAAVRRLRCERVDADAAALARRYQADAAVVEALTASRDLAP